MHEPIMSNYEPFMHLNLLSYLNMWAHSVRTKSAQPPDKVRGCKALTVLGIINLILTHQREVNNHNLNLNMYPLLGGRLVRYLICIFLSCGLILVNMLHDATIS